MESSQSNTTIKRKRKRVECNSKDKEECTLDYFAWNSETSSNDDDMNKEESNEEGAYIVDIDVEERSSTTRKSGQLTCMRSRKGKSREMDGIIAAMNRVADSLSEYVCAKTKGVRSVQEVVHDVMNEMENIHNLDANQWLKAVDWLSENPVKLAVLKALPVERKKDYILTIMP